MNKRILFNKTILVVYLIYILWIVKLSIVFVWPKSAVNIQEEYNILGLVLVGVFYMSIIALLIVNILSKEIRNLYLCIAFVSILILLINLSAIIQDGIFSEIKYLIRNMSTVVLTFTFLIYSIIGLKKGGQKGGGAGN